MKIESSIFSDFPQEGAIQIEINKIYLDVIDSIFNRCNNKVSGGAVRVAITEGNCRFNRDCGTECYTTVSDNVDDFGQFLYVGCSTGKTEYTNLAASFCPGYAVVSKHNGPLGFIGSAKLLCSHSNSSNNYCQFGPGVALKSTIDVAISYMNFANDTAYTEDDKYWIAVVFHYDCKGTVSQANFFQCKSLLKKQTKPYGTFAKCIFWRCVNYNINLLPSDNTESSPADFGFPLKCVARIGNSDRDCKNSLMSTALSIIASIMPYK